MQRICSICFTYMSVYCYSAVYYYSICTYSRQTVSYTTLSVADTLNASLNVLPWKKKYCSQAQNTSFKNNPQPAILLGRVRMSCLACDHHIFHRVDSDCVSHSPFFCSRSMESVSEEASGERQNSSGGLSVRENESPC